MGKENTTYHVVVKRGLHEDNFTCVPEGKARRILSRWSQQETAFIGSRMSLEEATKIATEETKVDGYHTESMGDTKLVSIGIVRED